MIPGRVTGQVVCPHTLEQAVRVGYRLAWQCQSCQRVVLASDLREVAR